MEERRGWISIDDKTWQYDDGGVRFFLLAGNEKALLIDSGMNVRNARELAGEMTDLNIDLFNTHADIDHLGSVDEFDRFYMNPAETVNFRRPLTSDRLVPVFDGDVIDLGGRTLRAIALPGHTPGSTALLDENTGNLFSGDPIQTGRIFMFGPMRSLPAYIHSLIRLNKMKDKIHAIYPAHAECPVVPELIERLIDGAVRIEKGVCPYTTAEFHGNKLRVYDTGDASFLCDDR